MLRLAAACVMLGSLLLATIAIVRPSGLTAPATAAEGPGPAPPGLPAGAPGLRPPAPAPVDSFVADRDSLMKVVLQRIAGREDMPAESVFKNIKAFKGVPAGRILRIMNMGFGRSLGVNCTHCHIAGHWADDDKPQKQITREMMAMVDTLNTVMLPRIRNLKSEHPTVNCTTCHRGSRKPATNL